MNRIRALERISIACFIGTSLAILYYVLFRHTIFWSSNTFLFDPTDRFNDFYNNYDNWNSKDEMRALQYVKQETGPSLQPLWDITSFSLGKIPNRHVALWTHNSLAIVTLIGVLSWAVRKIRLQAKHVLLSVLVLVGSSYPLLFVIDRANLEWLSAGFLVVALSLDEEKPRASAIALALAIAVKPWSAIIILWYLIQKRWGDVCRVVAVYMLLLVTATFGIRYHYGIDYRDNPFAALNVYSRYQVTMVERNAGQAFGHSLYGAIKYVFQITNESVPSWLTFGYFFFAVAITAVIAGLNLHLKLTGVAAYYPLLIAVSLLPWVSADYKLLNVLVCGVIVIVGWPETLSRTRQIHIVFFVILLIPKAYISLGRTDPQVISSSVSVSILLSPLCMVLLLTTYFIDIKQMRNQSIRSDFVVECIDRDCLFAGT